MLLFAVQSRSLPSPLVFHGREVDEAKPIKHHHSLPTHHPSKVRREGRRRAGFTLIEIVAVMAILMVLLLLIASTLWGAVKIERADSAVLHRVMVQAQLADRFREDVRGSVGCLDSFRDEHASPE